MSSLDLDIHQYSISDMEQLFKLKPNKKYTSSDIELRETELRTQLLSSGHIDKRLKRDLILFLTNVKQNLITTYGLHNKNPAPTTLNIPPLDESPNYPSSHNNLVSAPVYYPSINTKQNETETPISIQNSRINEIRSSSNTPFSYTQNSDFLPGTLNPLTTRILSRFISVDTRFRDSPYTTLSSDFSVHLPNRIQKVVSLELSSIEISPFSIQNISESLGNHYIHISVFYDNTQFLGDLCSGITPPSMTNYKFVLPDGQYTPTKLIDLLNLSFQEQNSTLSIHIDSYSGNTIIGSTNPNIVSISFDFSTDINGDTDKQDYFSKLGRLLGFNKRKYSGKISYMSETIINPYIALSYFFLSVDDFQNNSPPLFIPAFSRMTMSPSIIARMSLLKQSSNDHHILQPVQMVSEPRRYFGPIDIQRFHIRLLDAYGRILDMNGADYSFCLLLHVVYDL